ncbi:MAG TPA: type II and III secretion system protein family protein [Gammaproteobacteria bacterium]|nr:type II and III secretion system protein family protein [Gammaproteobacteria bacterium]
MRQYRPQRHIIKKRFLDDTLITLTLFFIFSFMLSGSSYGAAYDLVFGKAINKMDIPINQSRIMVFDEAIDNISIGNPDIADIVILESKKLYVLGKSLGSTNIVVWSKKIADRQYTTLTVNIVHDIDSLKNHIHDLFPEEKPQIRSAQGAIILSGNISSISKVEAIESLAKQFVKNSIKFDALKKKAEKQSNNGPKNMTEIINLMQVGGPHQVMLEVKIAEVSRTMMQRLGINLSAIQAGRPFKVGAVNGGSSFPNALDAQGKLVPLFPNDQSWFNLNDAPIGPPVPLYQPTTATIAGAGLFASFLSGNSYFNLVLDASKTNGLAKILAEPTLTALSGESAEFLSGGEFPVPIWNRDGTTIIFKKYGISVKMLPVVLNSKRINLNLNIGVSELSRDADVTFGVPGSTSTFSIPSLTTRSTSSTLEMMDGQTIGVAGLISDKMRESINKFPGLGDLPILGALFRSQSYIQEESELVMFITVHLAQPINPYDIRLPTDAFKAPSDADFFLFGRMASDLSNSADLAALENKKNYTPKNNKASYPLQTGGPTFGHQL